MTLFYVYKNRFSSGSVPLDYWYMNMLFPYFAERTFKLIIRERRENKVDFGIFKIKYSIQKSGTYERDAEFIYELKIIYLHVIFKSQ